VCRGLAKYCADILCYPTFPALLPLETQVQSMISETFSELLIEFNAVIEFANQSDNLAYRKELVTQARNVLNQAKDVWQEELTALRGMLQSLKEADRQRIKMAHRNGY
jgi:FtsZ-binding cell division protein ZapB